MTLVFAKEEEETQRHMLFGRQGQEGISGFTRKVVASGEDARVCYFILFYFFTVSFVFLFRPNYFFLPKSEMFPNISGMAWYFPVYRVALNDCVYFSLFIYLFIFEVFGVQIQREVGKQSNHGNWSQF